MRLPWLRSLRPSPAVGLMVRVIAVLMVLFALMRAALIVRNWTAGLATPAEIAWAFIVGLKFDLAIACYLTGPIVIASYIPRLPRRALLWTVTVVVSLLTFLLLAELEFFREFQSRYNQLAIRYLDHPAIVGGMVWYNYPVVRYVAAWLVIAVGIYFAMRWAIRQRPERRNVVSELLSGVVIVAVLVIGGRGGLRGEPLRWGDAFRGNNEFANQMSLNGLFSLNDAVKDLFKRDRAAAGWRRGGVSDADRAVVRSMLVAPGERLIHPETHTVLRDGDAGSNLILRRTDGRPVNVVVVMMESFSARYVGACGAPFSVTPCFNAIARDGILFDRCLSAGSHTHQGIFATQLGFPNLPAFERLMDAGVSNQEFLSFGEIFAAKGYDTFFLYNGDLAWDNMRGFFRKQGVNHFIDGADMTADARYRDAVWGVSDGDLFDRANREFEAASKKGPFMAAIMTLSNHAPFQVPPVPGAEPITGFGEDNRRLEAMRYADYALGQFIAGAKKLSYFRDTLFVFVGDHGFHVAPKLTEVHLLFHHVPLLFYAPGLTDRRGVDHRVATHMNIQPSVLALLGMNDSPRSPWGRSLFNDSFNDDGVAVFKMSTGTPAVAMARGDKVLILGSATGKPQLMRYSLAFPPSAEPLSDPALQQSMERDLRAYVKCGLEDLATRHAGAD